MLIVVKRPGQDPERREIEAPIGIMAYEDMKGLLDGGWLELVRLQELPDVDLWIDEDGKTKGLPVNFPIRHGLDIIVGPAFFAGSDQEGNTVGLTEKQAEMIETFLARSGTLPPRG